MKPGGPTIDQLIAQAIGGTTQFRSVQAAVSRSVLTSEGPLARTLSHQDSNTELPPEFDPLALFNRLFVSFAPPDPRAPTAAHRVSVLDAVRDSAARLRKRLSSSDRQRLDQHLTSIAEVRSRLQTLPPPPPSAACVQRPAPVVQNVGDEPKEAVVRVMNELIVLAFACDLTRVASLALTQLSGNPVYGALGHDGQQHTLQEYPLVIGGRGGGVLAHPGKHVREAGANTSNVLLSCMRACGVSTQTIGTETCASSTPCEGVLA